MKKLIWIIVMAGVSIFLSAQNNEELLQQLLEEDRSRIEALVLYPEQSRLAMLEASMYPEVLIKLQAIQQQISQQFQQLLEPYSRSEQQMVWDLTRYPDLIDKLVNEGQGKESNIQEVLEWYPEAVYNRAMEAGKYHYPLLVKIVNLENKSDAAFRSMVTQYPPDLQRAMEELLALPEVLDILTDNISFTVLVGETYRNDQEWILHKADSLHLVLAQQQAHELEDWKNKVDNDPKASEELQTAAQSFAREYGYDDLYYEEQYQYDDLYYEEGMDPEPERRVVEKHHYYHHYPYWFGYPYWYVYPRWRPYPLWHEWGFYYQPGQTIMVIGLPSYYSTNWFFYHSDHCYLYPYLSTHFVDYYYGHRRSISSIVVGVERWKDRHPLIKDAWLSEPNHRVDRIREFGQMETARRGYNRRNSDKQLSQEQYIKQNTRKYDQLSKATSRTQREVAPENRSRKDRFVSPPRTTIPGKAVPKTETPREQPPADRNKIDKTATRKQKTPAKTSTTVPKKDNKGFYKEMQKQPKVRTQPRVSKPKTSPQQKAPKTKKNAPSKSKRDNNGRDNY